jgi:hypothetical protein
MHSLQEVNTAYAMLELRLYKNKTTWHEQNQTNIRVRTRVGADILTYVQSNYHYLGVEIDDLCAEIEHYHFVTSPSIKEYMSLDRALCVIKMFAQSRDLAPINFNVLQVAEKAENVRKLRSRKVKY